MRKVLIGATVLTAAMLTGCARDVINVENAPVTSATGASVTPEQVREAIVRAAWALGWTVKDTGPGTLSAMFMQGKASAEIEIPYSASSYSLIYKSSEGLHAAHGQVHRIYNRWIESLNRRINVQLATS